MEKHNEKIYSATAYDDAFRTMEGECDDIVIGLVNHMFGEKYDKTAVITRLRNEHFVELEDGPGKKRITDSSFEIRSGNVSKKYHVECESKEYDGTILVRIFEYDAQIALDNANRSLDKIHIKFPNTGLLLLRGSDRAPEIAGIEIELPGGKQAAYDVPIVKVSDYTIEDIIDKRLFMLIPFFIFNYEDELKDMNDSEERLDGLIETYADIFDRLAHELDNGSLSVLSYSAIIRLTHSVALKLTQKQGNAQRKVGDMMGGKILDLPEIRIYHEGLAKGEQERKELKTENEHLRAKNGELEAKNDELEMEKADLKEERDSLKEVIIRLRAENEQLKKA